MDLWIAVGCLMAITGLILLFTLHYCAKMALPKAWLHTPGVMTGGSLIVLFILSAPVLYHYWGSSAQWSAWQQAQQTASAVKKLSQELKTPEQVIARLQQAVQKHPESAEGWYFLGRIFVTQQRYPEAVNALQKAYQLNKTDIKTLMQYAQALYFANHNTLTPQARLLIDQVLAKDPTNAGVINLLGVAAYHDGHYADAVRYWEKILPQYDVKSPEGQMLLEAIAEAQKKL